MPLSGTTGYVIADGVTLSADKWDASLDQVAVNRANFTTAGEPSNSAGQRTGQISLEGPMEDGTVALVRGALVTFKLGLTDTLFVTVNARVTNFNPSNDSNDGPRFKVTAQQHGAATFNLG